MKHRITILLLALFATTSLVTAQNHDKRIAQIRQAYADRLEIMNNSPYDVPCNFINNDLAQNLPGSGLHERHDKYYFTQEQYSEDGKMASLLYYVTSKDTYAMGMHVYNWEFLWDAMEGDPMFALLVRQEGNAKKEYRFYFEKNKVIKVVPEFKQWPLKDMMSLHPYVIDKPDDVLKLMKQYQTTFNLMLRDE